MSSVQFHTNGFDQKFRAQIGRIHNSIREPAKAKKIGSLDIESNRFLIVRYRLDSVERAIFGRSDIMAANAVGDPEFRRFVCVVG